MCRASEGGDTQAACRRKVANTVEQTRLGFAMCGSFCTYDRVLEVLRTLAETYTVTPIISESSAVTDTRFGTAAAYLAKIEEICGRPPIASIRDAEPIGPKKLLDALVIAPCTGNTLAKLASGITDTSVTMAAKAHLRNDRPLIIAVSTNDALSGSAKNIGELLNRRNVYFVPMGQDDPVRKPRSVVADMEKIPQTVQEALSGRQIQPILGR